MINQNSKKQNGFTMMELILVVAIMGIAAAVAIPAFMGWLPVMRLNGAAREIMGDLMDARMEAVKHNNPFKIFVLNNHEYKILDDDDSDGIDDSGSETSRTVDIRSHYSDVTINYTGSLPTITFSPKGTATDLDTITVQNSSGSKSISVSVAGRVRIN